MLYIYIILYVFYMYYIYYIYYIFYIIYDKYRINYILNCIILYLRMSNTKNVFYEYYISEFIHNIIQNII